jgi:deoxyribodipyrimidine photolyase-related protein
MIFLILPNQLFEDVKPLNAYDELFIIEEPHYFSTAEIKPNKIKIAYMRACMRFYYDKLKKEGFKITYINFSDLTKPSGYSFMKKDDCYCYDLNDFKLRERYKSLKLPELNEIETPMFIMKRADLDVYNKKTKSPTHASFYEFSKKKLGLLEGVKNQDAYNRSNPRETIDMNNHQSYINTNQSYYKEAIDYANSNLFKSHIGNASLESMKYYPINSKDAYDAFHYFLNKNLSNFGLFQDVIRDNNPFNYHALISPMLNIGLLNPLKLVDIYRKYKDKVPLTAYEGFIRQLIGWREYMRYLYLYKYDELIKSNNHHNNKTIDKSWYSGTTGILILDNEIKKAITYGYAHHIVRLMVFLNFFILTEIRPSDIYKWFMEVVSIDAYDWVMIPNIYSMGYFSSIGMRRPYLSSSNYLLKMSNYKKDGKWDVIWTDKYRSFVKSRKINFYLRSIKE